MCGRGLTRPSGLRPKLCTTEGKTSEKAAQGTAGRFAHSMQAEASRIYPGRLACRRVKQCRRSTTAPAIRGLQTEKRDPRNPTERPDHQTELGTTPQPWRRDQRREIAPPQRQKSPHENARCGHAERAGATPPEGARNPEPRGGGLRRWRCHRPEAGSLRQRRSPRSLDQTSSDPTTRRSSGRPATTRCRATWARVMPRREAAEVKTASTPGGRERFSRMRSEPMCAESVTCEEPPSC